MIEFIRKLDSEEISSLKRMLENFSDTLTEDVSSYAKGRKRVWLNHEWDLLHRNFKPALRDEDLWNDLKLTIPEAELGLASYGSVGIKLHRDDSYADWKAYGINLGKCTWLYERSYPGYCWTKERLKAQVEEYKLEGGEIFSFNCKNRHAAVDCSPDRWSINLWHINKNFRQEFEKYAAK